MVIFRDCNMGFKMVEWWLIFLFLFVIEGKNESEYVFEFFLWYNVVVKWFFFWYLIFCVEE